MSARVRQAHRLYLKLRVDATSMEHTVVIINVGHYDNIEAYGST